MPEKSKAISVQKNAFARFIKNNCGKGEIHIRKGPYATVKAFKKGCVTMPFAQAITNCTIEDIYALPEGTRAELINGQIFYMAPPTRKHQRILAELFSIINNYIKEKGGSCEVDIAPFAVFLNADSRTYVEPDISVICDKSKLDDRGCHGAPDWVIEIVSPSSTRMDYLTKLFKYAESGVREYWIVDPLKNAIFVYNFEDKERFQLCSFSDTVRSEIFEDLEIDFSKLDL